MDDTKILLYVGIPFYILILFSWGIKALCGCYKRRHTHTYTVNGDDATPPFYINVEGEIKPEIDPPPDYQQVTEINLPPPSYAWTESFQTPNSQFQNLQSQNVRSEDNG